MAGSVEGWVATNTGLPSFKVLGPGVLKSGSRVIVEVGEGQTAVVADPLASVGVTTVYTFGGTQFGLVRKILGHGTVRSYQAQITGIDGRGPVVDFYENTGEVRKFKSGSSTYSNGVMRGAPGLDEREGKARLVLDSASKLDALGGVLEQSGPVLIVLGAPALGVPGVRCVFVREVQYVRTGVDGSHRVDITWERVPFPHDAGAWRRGYVSPTDRDVGASVLTWGDCEDAGVLWGDSRTISQIGVAITGGAL